MQKDTSPTLKKEQDSRRFTENDDSKAQKPLATEIPQVIYGLQRWEAHLYVPFLAGPSRIELR